MNLDDDNRRFVIGNKLLGITLNMWNDTFFLIFRLLFIELWITSQQTPHRTDMEIMLKIKLIRIINAKIGLSLPIAF